jgi:hypothetical protein
VAPGKKLIGAREILTPRRLAVLFGEALGKDIDFVDSAPSLGDLGDPDLSKGLFDMVGWCAEFGYDGAKIDGSVVKPQELGVPLAMGSVKKWFEDQEWEQVFRLD